MTQETSMPQNNGEIDLRDVLRKLQANARLILATTLLTGLGAFWYFKSQTPIFASTARVLSTNNNSNAASNTALTSQMVSSNPLPREAIEAAMVGTEVLNAVRNNLDGIPELSPKDKAELNDKIDQAIGNQRAGLVYKLSGRLDLYGNGVYTITAEHPNPAVAAGLANLAADELVRWDSDRIRKTVKDVIASLEAQIKDIDRRINNTAAKSTVRETLLLQRTQRTEELDNARLLTYSTRNTLSLVTRAATPLKAVRPVPSLYAALAALVALVGSSLFVFLRSSVQKPIENGDDLKSMQIQVIGKLPRISQGRGSILAAMTQGTTAEALRFVQVSLNTILSGRNPKIVLVTSCAPAEGKSSISAGLAYAFASSGQNVLLIDADIHRPSQLKTWGAAAERAPWMNLESGRIINVPEGRGFHNAIRDPQIAQVMQLGGNLHLMPSYPSGTRNERFSAVKELENALERWGSQYDMIIIDAPPALATVDAMLMAPLVSGVLMVVEARKTGQSEIAQVVESISLTGARVLGAVLNKIDVLNKSDYYGGYGYSYMGNKPSGEASSQGPTREPVRR